MIATYANLIIQIRVHIEKFHDKPLKSTLMRISRFSRHIARRLNKELKRCEMYSSTHFFVEQERISMDFLSRREKGERGDLLTCEKLPNMGSNKRWQESPLPWRWQYQQQQQQKQKRKLKQGTMMSQPQRKQKQHIFDTDMIKTVGFDSKNRRHTQSDRVRNIEVGRLIRAEVGNAWDAPYSR